MIRKRESTIVRRGDNVKERLKIGTYKKITPKTMEEIRKHKDLKVFKLSFEAGMEVFQLSKKFPKEETYSLKDQIRRSSRSVSGNNLPVK